MLARPLAPWIVVLLAACGPKVDGGGGDSDLIPAETDGVVDTEVDTVVDTEVDTVVDTVVADTEAGDTDVADTDAADTDVADTVVADTDVADTVVADTDVADTVVGDTDVADTDVADTVVADTQVADTQVADTDTAPPDPDADGDGYPASVDCDDARPTAYPGADERCDGRDDDCDGTIDEDPVNGRAFFVDADGDRHGGATTVVACTLPDGAAVFGDDCDDARADVHPGAPERCDGVDQDCDGRIDDAPVDPATWYADADADGFGDAATVAYACAAPQGFVADAADCDDDRDGVYPGADEVCDGLDDDCDGAIDEDALDALLWHDDVDGDGYGDPLATVRACAAPADTVADATDCDDARGAVHPGATETCATDYDDDCDGLANEAGTPDLVDFHADVDGDGHGAGPVVATACTTPPGTSRTADDCDDRVATVFPGAPEHCDDVDEDCDGTIDDAAVDPGTTFDDLDGDGFGDAAAPRVACDPPAGTVGDATDCDDDLDAVHPGAPEVCDGLDDDCDGAVDEDAVDALPFQADVDLDGYGDPDAVTWACTAPPGTVTDATDCDDGDATRSPGDPERCATPYDDDCDGLANEADAVDPTAWSADVDRDGYGAGAPTLACAAPTGTVADATDCDDARATVHPGAAERCNGLDDDCDGTIDDGALDVVTVWLDLDHDGYGDAASPVTSCDPPADGVADATDCDDAAAAVHPGATEVCNGLDDDCDGEVDLDAVDRLTWYADADADGYGVTATATLACDAPPVGTWALLPGDCRDANAAVNPAAPERCATLYDDDCDGTANEPSAIDAPTWVLDNDNDGFGGGAGIVSCTPQSGRISTGGDCDDTQRSVLPGGIELCDGQRNDCDDPAWTASKEDGKVSQVTPQGAWFDVTARFAGTYTMPAGTLWVCPGTYPVRVTTSVIDQLVSIRGRGPASSVVLDAGPLVAAGSVGPVLRLAGTSMTRVAASSLTLKGGRHTYGGGIAVDAGRLDATGLVVAGNRGTTHGGGVAARQQTYVTLVDCELRDNVSAGDGGGLHAAQAQQVVLSGTTTVHDNQAQARGGGVFSDSTGAFDLTGVTLARNVAGGAGGNGYLTMYQGAITDVDVADGYAALDGGGLYVSTATASAPTFRNVLLQGNTAAAGHGGGLRLWTGASVRLDGIDALDNVAGGRGGGLYLEDGFATQLVDATVADNAATADGGGLYVLGAAPTDLVRVAVTGNVTSATGGGVAAGDAVLSLTDCHVDDNRVLGNAATRRGAGLAMNAPSSAAGLYVRGGTIARNTFETVAGSDGGGVWAGIYGGLLSGVTVADNVAARGGGLFLSARNGAGIDVAGGAVLRGNTATQGGGAFVFGGTLSCVGAAGETTGFLDNLATSSSGGGGVHVASGTVSAAPKLAASLCDFGTDASVDDNVAGASSSSDVRWGLGALDGARGDDATFTCDGVTGIGCL